MTIGLKTFGQTLIEIGVPQTGQDKSSETRLTANIDKNLQRSLYNSLTQTYQIDIGFIQIQI